MRHVELTPYQMTLYNSTDTDARLLLHELVDQAYFSISINRANITFTTPDGKPVLQVVQNIFTGD